MKTLSLLFLCLIITSAASAETFKLKSGRTVSGTVIERNEKSIKLDVDGIPMTYYMDELEEQASAPAQAAVTQPVAPQESIPALPTPIASESNKRDLILKFIDVFGTRAAMTQNLEAMMQSLPPDNPQTKQFKEMIKVDEIINRLIPIYDKQFSAQELQTYIDFYSSPQGKKLIAGIALIMKESIDVSAQYFKEKFPEEAGENK